MVRSRHFDALGASTVTAGLLLLVYGLNRGVSHGWVSATTLAVFAGAAALLAMFVRVESRSRSPLVPFAALRNRTMVAADLAAFLLFGAFFSFIFLVSLLLQQMLHYSPTKTGLAWFATSVTGFFAAGIAGAKLVSTFERDATSSRASLHRMRESSMSRAALTLRPDVCVYAH